MFTERIRDIEPPPELPECALVEAIEAAYVCYHRPKQLQELLGFDAPEIGDLLVAYKWVAPQVSDEDVRDYWRDLVGTIEHYRQCAQRRGGLSKRKSMEGSQAQLSVECDGLINFNNQNPLMRQDADAVDVDRDGDVVLVGRDGGRQKVQPRGQPQL